MRDEAAPPGTSQPPGTRPWHHTDKGFRNPPGSPARPAGSFWPMAGFLWRRFRDRRAPVPPPGHVLPEAVALEGFRALGGADGVTWLGHVAFLLRLGGLTVLTDPYLGDWAGPWKGAGARRFVPPGIRAENLPPIDVLVLSHNHYDHLCVPTLRALKDRHRLLAVVPLGLGPMLKRLGYANVVELDWHGSVRHRGLTVTAAPAIHASSRTGFDFCRTLWCAYVLEAGGRRVWFGGDSGYGPVFGETGAAYGPFDLAMVGIGAYEPRALMRAVHTDPEEAVRIARDLRARRVLGMHWGTVLLTEEDPFEPPGRFRAAAAAAGYAPDDAWLLAIGESRAL
ncbi:MAG TPA: MBL fold metallo-hydrolase [Azospirillaceae bacterium]|nr:MBL fold metallo-hydrolase [Azospirillaceae bacterium]